MDSTASQRRRSRLRRQYRPDRVELLFIGEAPPASGRFFYQRDSGLYRAIRDAFGAADSSITDANFLERFKASGCYLIDVCPHPVDQLDPPSRRAACLQNEPQLCQAIKKLQPNCIITMLHSIRANVQRAAARAEWNGRFLELPYPGRWIRHRETFITELLPELKALVERE